LRQAVQRHAVTPEWREENERKQLAYELKRRQWRKQLSQAED